MGESVTVQLRLVVDDCKFWGNLQKQFFYTIIICIIHICIIIYLGKLPYCWKNVTHIYNLFFRSESLLAELQFAFICFLIGQVWDGWEHWKRLVIAICKAEEFLKKYPQLYTEFLSVLYYQIEEVRKLLFYSINWIFISLRKLALFWCYFDY